MVPRAAWARLTISGRSESVLKALADELGEAVVGSVAADLTLPGSPDDILRAATSDGRELDRLVYAAGVVAFGPLTEVDDDDLDEVLLLNLVAPMRLLRESAPQLGKDSVVVHLSAVVADKPTAGMAVYSASKVALTGFSRAMAMELRRQSTRVLDVRPPHTDTGLASRPIAGEAPRLGGGKTPESVAERIVAAIADDERDLDSSSFE